MASIKKELAFERMEQDGFEPVAFGEYTEENGWSYPVAQDADKMYFARHKLTGQMYKWNQRSYIFRHGFNVDFAMGRMKKHNVVIEATSPVAICKELVKKMWHDLDASRLILLARAHGVHAGTANIQIKKAIEAEYLV